MSELCPQCHEKIPCQECRYSSFDLVWKAKCPSCRGRTHLPREHICCRVVDVVQGPGLQAKLNHVLSRPDARGDTRATKVWSNRPLIERITDRPLKMVFGDRYLSALPDEDEPELEARKLFPGTRSLAYVGFARIISVTLRQFTDSALVHSVAFGLAVQPDGTLGLDLRFLAGTLDTTRIEVDRTFLGTTAPYYPEVGEFGPDSWTILLHTPDDPDARRVAACRYQPGDPRSPKTVKTPWPL